MTEALKRKDMMEPGALTTLHDRGAISGDVNMSSARGGVRFENMLQVMEFAKLMAVADIGVPKHLRANPGACMRVALQADEWGFSPFAVADKSYLVSDRLAYESQLIHAVVERRAPLAERLRPSWSGEGPTRRCKVTGVMIGERDPFIWEGPMFKDIKVKNSPEWTANPDKQLFYHASRDWARIYVPDVLLGVYSRDELEAEADRARASSGNTGTIADNLPKQIDHGPKDGFDGDGIAKTLSVAPVARREEEATDHPAEDRPATAKRSRRKAPPEEEPIEAAGPQEPEAAAPPILKPIREPTNNDEYKAYAEHWIGKEDSEQAARERWEAEREMRAKCRVTIATRKVLEKLLTATFEEK